jgi:ParB-like chromosome segregation protein Spo0J
MSDDEKLFTSDDLKLEIVYLPVDALTPYTKNARKHTQADIETIKQSILAFKFDDPIGIWGDNNIIVEGHGRLIAAKELGYTEVPCVRLDHLSDEQRRAYALAHNKTAEMSEWDFDILGEEMAELTAFDVDLSAFGFEEPEVIDWADVDDLTEKTYKEPETVKLKCPHCQHIDVKAHFLKV